MGEQVRIIVVGPPTRVTGTGKGSAEGKPSPGSGEFEA